MIRNDSSRYIRYQKARRGRRRRLLYFGLLMIVGVIVFISAGPFLVVHEAPRKADAIIVLSGGPNRLEQGLKLWDEGYADHLILSNGRAFDVDPSASIIMEDRADSTLDNAAYTKEIMQARQWRSAIVVSSNYHMRRVKYLFDKTYRGSGIELTYVASESPLAPPAKWWSTKSSRRTTLNEYAKIVGNTFGWHGSEAKSALRRMNRWLF